MKEELESKTEGLPLKRRSYNNYYFWYNSIITTNYSWNYKLFFLQISWFGAT